MESVTAEPIAFDAEFSDPDNLRVPRSVVEKLRDQLGHEPQAGDVVRVSVMTSGPCKRRSFYGALRETAPSLAQIDIAELRQEISAQLHSGE